MKHIIATILISLFAGSMAFAQDFKAPGHNPEFDGKGKPMHQDMHQEMRKYPTKEEIQSQKIAFFTQELSLSPKEAEKFWPVYNECNKNLHDARKQINVSLKNLQNALNAEDAVSDTEIKSLMDKYLKACEEEIAIQKQNFAKLSKVLPMAKAAKTFSLEERFRVMLIRRLRR